MPICIAGMHRSGTSLLSRLLNQCGLYIGPDADILPAEPSNTEGHWENLRFQAINETLLAQLKCAWDLVRPLEDQWDLAASYDSIREQAVQLVKTFEGREPWGWKDPRNSLTMPFWLRLIPNLKVIICVRHPLEVAASLRARDRMPAPVGIRLWIDYYTRLLKDVAPERRLVVHYQSLLCDTHAELSRALQFAEIAIKGDTLASVACLPKKSMRHHCVPFAELLEPHIPVQLVRDYVGSCSKAGPTCHRWMRAELAPLAGSECDVADPESFFGAAAARIVERERYVTGLECDDLERYAHSIKAENVELLAACAVSQCYAQSLLAENATLKAMRTESACYAQSLLAENTILKAMRGVGTICSLVRSGASYFEPTIGGAPLLTLTWDCVKRNLLRDSAHRIADDIV